MESKHLLSALSVIWIATALVVVYAPEMVLANGDTIPITSWIVPICAVIATFFVARLRKKE